MSRDISIVLKAQLSVIISLRGIIIAIPCEGEERNDFRVCGGKDQIKMSVEAYTARNPSLYQQGAFVFV